jgi:hypothetical protein
MTPDHKIWEQFREHVEETLSVFTMVGLQYFGRMTGGHKLQKLKIIAPKYSI